MKKLVIAAALLLSACAHGPDVPPSTPVAMPALPPELSKKAEKLPPITDNSLGGIQNDAVETDKKYNTVSRQLNAVIDAWACVKEALATQKEVKTCF